MALTYHRSEEWNLIFEAAMCKLITLGCFVWIHLAQDRVLYQVIVSKATNNGD